MQTSLLTTLFASSCIALGIVHIFATKFYLYWKYPMLDMPVHVLGGVTVVLGFFLLQHLTSFPRRVFTLVQTLVVALGIGLLWEVVEVIIGVSIVEVSFYSDSLSDLFMDVCGGGIGFTLIYHLKKL